jgi:hypothetical protein
MKRSAVKYSTLRSLLLPAGDRLQQVGIAEPDTGVDVERVEHQRFAAPAGRDLPGRGVGEGVGAADDERLEGEALVERRTAERLVHGHERHARPYLDAVMAARVELADGRRQLRRFRFHRERADRGRTDVEFKPGDDGIFGLPIAQYPLAVVRLDPIAQEAGRHRQSYRALVDGFELHARKPAGEYVLAEFGAQALLDLLPALLIGARHRRPAYLEEGTPKRATQARTHLTLPNITETQRTFEEGGRSNTRARLKRGRRPEGLLSRLAR